MRSAGGRVSGRGRAARPGGGTRRGLPVRGGRLVGALVVGLLAGLAGPLHAAETVPVAGFGANPGGLRMFEYVPDGLQAGAPLVVALHGCTQGALAFDDESGWTELADRLRFALLLPEQTEANNARRCFNWFSADHNRRDRGEAASIAAMVARMRAAHGLDPGRTFVTGLSAGGAMTAVMLAAYPEMFRAGAILAGTPYGCASPHGEPLLVAQKGVITAFLRAAFPDQAAEAGWAAWQCGISLSPALPRPPTASHLPTIWRDLLAEAGAPTPPRWPRVSLWHGRDDPTVNPRNLVELMEQWTAAHGLDQIPDASRIVSVGPTRYQHQEYKDAAGETRVETYEFSALGHAVPIKAGSGPGACGRAAPHFRDVGVCAAAAIAGFWGLAP